MYLDVSLHPTRVYLRISPTRHADHSEQKAGEEEGLEEYREAPTPPTGEGEGGLLQDWLEVSMAVSEMDSECCTSLSPSLG